MSLIQEYDHLKIPLHAIRFATNNFSIDNYIGRGGFGIVYKGTLLHTGQQVAVKRLDRRLGQGDTEFWKEILILSSYNHENLVSLLGFCDEGRENILVYEYLPKESLDKYLNNDKLSWVDRLRICIGAARGLEYLHNPHGSIQRVIHRDIKSANILLDANWNAKISDFGLSKFGHANHDCSLMKSSVAGTPGYCDPLFIYGGLMTKESDIYSFGVVLLEVLCGRRALGDYSLSTLAKKCYKENNMGAIVLDSLKEQIEPLCLDKFSTIVYRCLHEDRNQRPQIAEIKRQLKAILGSQIACNVLMGDNCEEKKLKSRTLFHLIETPEVRTFMEKGWSNMKAFTSVCESILDELE